MITHRARSLALTLLGWITCLGSAVAQSELPLSEIHWLDVAPSEDTQVLSLRSVGRIEFSPNGKHIFFGHRFLELNEAYLWHIEDGNYSEYCKMPLKFVEQNRNRPFAKPPHPLRREVISVSDRTERANMNALLDNGFSLSKGGKFSTVKYFTTDWNLREATSSVSTPSGMPQAYSSKFILQDFPDPNYARNAQLNYGIVDLAKPTIQTMPLKNQIRPARFCLGEHGLSVACFFDRGIEIHSLMGRTPARTVRFAYPFERPQISCASYMKDDEWLVCILQQPGQPGVSIWVIDARAGTLVQSIDAPGTRPVDARFSPSGTRCFYRSDGPGGQEIACFEIQAGKLLKGDIHTTDTGLAELATSTVYQCDHDGKTLAFVQNFSDRTPSRVGLVEWP